MALYPLKFEPRFVEKMWGGQALARVAGKRLPSGKPIGESWELYDFPPGAVGADATQPGDRPDVWVSSPVANGPLAGQTLHEVLLSHGAALLGGAAAVATPAGPQFPLLIKFLDARQDLSVQVHPPEAYTKNHPGTAVKNECWHVLDHDADARILIGTVPGTTRDAFAESIRAGTCEDLLNAVKVADGDTFYLPSGTVHALGAGAVVAEVQTPSDTTFRVYDFDRVEPKTGKPRALHVEPALACIDFSSDARQHHVPPGPGDATVVRAPQFTLGRRSATAGATVDAPAGALCVLIVLEGSGTVGRGDATTDVARGDTVVVPASVDGTIVATTAMRWLEATLPTHD